MHGRATPILTAFILLAMSAVLLESTASAETRGKQTAEAHYEKGMKAYTLGHFPEAIEEFEKAYEVRSEPIFLYNIAQSHRQNNNLQRAIFFYRRYLEAEPNAKNRLEIEKRIRDLETELTEQKEHASTPAPATPTPPVAPAPIAPPPVPAPVAQPMATTPQPLPASAPAPSGKPGAGLRIAGITSAAVGVAGIGLGIGFGLHANTLHDEAFPRPPASYDDAKYQSSKTYRTLEWVSFTAGGALIVTGGLLYYFGWSAESDAPVALAPLVTPGTAGAMLAGRF